jgi:hypothetical protein
MTYCKHWVFTINNYDENDEQRLRDLGTSENTNYLVFGREVGEEGTPHLQGYCIFTKKKRFNAAKAQIGVRAHLEAKRGTPQEAAEYCKKDGDYEEFGTTSTNQGRRTDLEELHDRIKDGASREDIIDEFPNQYYRYKRSIDEVIKERQPNERQPCYVFVLWGDTGTGKTRTIWDSHEADDIYVHTGSGWFDGYRGQPIALFDDYGGGEFKLSYLLKLLDRYPMRVPVKGSFVVWNPAIIYITSNKDPSDWYANAYQEHQNALHRRFHHVFHFTKEGEKPDVEGYITEHYSSTP